MKAAAQLLAAKKLDLIDAHLAGKDYMLGERRSFLDAYVVPMFRWGRAMLPGGLDSHPNCERLLQRLQAEDIAKKVFADEGL